MKFIKYLIFGLVLLLLLGGGVLLWKWQKANNAEAETARVFQEQIKKANPEIYRQLIKTADEARLKTEKDSKDFQSWMDLGVSSQNLGNKAEAEKAYKQAIRINRNSFVAWNNLASLYRDQADYPAARDSYLEIIKFAPSETSAYLNLAELYVAGKGGTIADARAVLEQGLKVNPSPALKSALDQLSN